MNATHVFLIGFQSVDNKFFIFLFFLRFDRQAYCVYSFYFGQMYFIYLESGMINNIYGIMNRQNQN